MAAQKLWEKRNKVRLVEEMAGMSEIWSRVNNTWLETNKNQEAQTTNAVGDGSRFLVAMTKKLTMELSVDVAEAVVVYEGLMFARRMSILNVMVKEDADNHKKASSSLLFQSSDDEEANEDLSLKIVEKALRMREAKLKPNDGVLDGEGGVDVGVDAAEIKTKRKKKKAKKVESEDRTVIVAEEQETVEAIKPSETNESTEASTVQMGDNIVLRKLLRGPRYFDPPDSNWVTCYNCGEGGHTAANCKVAKRKRPCFVCGSLEHSVKQCNKGRDCFICKKGGHRAKDCPEKHTSGSKSSTACLKCGNSGHDMFSCMTSYSLDDLKVVLIHVICSPFSNFLSLATLKYNVMSAKNLATYAVSKILMMFHICNADIPQARKRNRDLSNTRTPRSYKEKDYMGHKSAPPDMGKARKKKKVLTEDIGVTTPKKSKRRGGWTFEDPGEYSSPKFKERGATTAKKPKRRGGWMTEDPAEFSSPKFKEKSKHRGGWITEDPGEFSSPRFKEKSKHRGGWITEDPGEFSSPRFKEKSKHRGGWIMEDPGQFPPPTFTNRWMSPGTPSSRSTGNFYPYNGGSHTPAPRWMGHPGSSKSQGSANSYQRRFSASRFGNSSSDQPRYDWW
ncbi:zinc finger CCHC domain-containing protein 7-like [Senna tora]|uniref:Zinc finger CCHC domain-containing protein 7-like n=1 Tax=Senna tora TaxID=362788 RepID=A0A834T556_9FABA|nr:zinc finger CCHC domain-containing protein 7-like [Senna tora]